MNCVILLLLTYNSNIPSLSSTCFFMLGFMVHYELHINVLKECVGLKLAQHLCAKELIDKL